MNFKRMPTGIKLQLFWVSDHKNTKYHILCTELKWQSSLIDHGEVEMLCRKQ